MIIVVSRINCPCSGGNGECFFKKDFFFKNKTSMSTVPHLRSDDSDECVFVGLGDGVQHSSFCDLCFLVIF